MKRIALLLLVLLIALTAVLVARAYSVTSRQISAPAAPPLAIDRNAALARFARAVQFRTVSYDGHAPEPVEHEAFLAWLAQAYPRVHASLTREVVNGRSLLFTWRGSDPSLPPLLLMGHYDVVPVEPGTESRWEQPPFSGAIVNGYVWGRGTLDDKITVISILEAAEELIARGFRPKQTILFAFGHDEELGGMEGASHTARLLASRGVKLDAVLDEGGVITVGSLRGAPRPVALIGIAEKGSASVELRARGEGGHSSMPPPRTEVGAIAAAVARVQSHPFSAGVHGAANEMFRWLAPEMPFGRRLVMANLWLFAPLLSLEAKHDPALNAMLRTTTAPTIIEGGVKDNVVPSQARAIVNFRIMPGETAASVAKHVRDAIDDAHVTIAMHGTPWNPSPVSNPGAPQFARVQRTIARVFPNVIVSPYLVVGATDGRWFAPLSPNVYRFAPFAVTPKDLERVHGTNERIAVAAYFESIRFFRTLMEDL